MLVLTLQDHLHVEGRRIRGGEAEGTPWPGEAHLYVARGLRPPPTPAPSRVPVSSAELPGLLRAGTRASLWNPLSTPCTSLEADPEVAGVSLCCLLPLRQEDSSFPGEGNPLSGQGWVRRPALLRWKSGGCGGHVLPPPVLGPGFPTGRQRPLQVLPLGGACESAIGEAVVSSKGQTPPARLG